MYGGFGSTAQRASGHSKGSRNTQLKRWIKRRTSTLASPAVTRVVPQVGGGVRDCKQRLNRYSNKHLSIGPIRYEALQQRYSFLVGLDERLGPGSNAT